MCSFHHMSKVRIEWDGAWPLCRAYAACDGYFNLGGLFGPPDLRCVR